MTIEQLKIGREIQDKLKSWESLDDHLNRTVSENTDFIKEVQELTTGYNNLMSGFNRQDIAKIMIDALKIKATEQVARLTNEFNEL